MSVILKKRVYFFKRNSHFWEKGGLFSPYLTVPSRQHSRVLLDRAALCRIWVHLHARKSAFCKKRVSFEISKVSVFFCEKVS